MFLPVVPTSLASVTQRLNGKAFSEESGAPGRNRTRDLRFTKPLLYQLSYKGMAVPLAYSAAQ